MTKPENRKPRGWRAVSVFAASAVLLALAHAEEPPAVAEARRALEERLPDVAVAKLARFLGSAVLIDAERQSAVRLLGEAQVAAGRYDAALATVQALADGGDAVALLTRAHALAGRGEWALARPIYQRLAETPGAPLSARMGLAEAWQALGQIPKAIAALEPLAREQPEDSTLHLRLACLYVDARRPDKVRPLLKMKMKRTDPEARWWRYLQGRLLLLQGEPEQAMAAFERILKKREYLSENIQVAATLGVADAKLAAESVRKAEKWLEGFIYKNPQSAWLELVFRRLDEITALDDDPAESDYHKWAASPEMPRAALALFYVGKMQVRAQRREKAKISLVNFAQRYAAHPLAPRAHLLLADLFLEARGYEKAVASLEAAMRGVGPEDAAFRGEIELRTALVHYRSGQNVLAAQFLDNARQNAPALRAIATFDAALAWLGQGNAERFREEYESLGALAGAEPRALLALEHGLSLARRGEGEARAVLADFLRQQPGHARAGEARLALAELAFLEGDTGAAANYLQVAGQAPRAPEMDDQAAYLAIVLADSATPRDEARVLALGEEFLKDRPQAKQRAEVRMKLGQVYFRRDDFANAETQFALLAKEGPAGQFAETALFLAGQAAMRALNEGSVERALASFEQVIKRDGALKLRARQQQAIIQSQLGREAEAVRLYELILAAEPEPEPELRYAAMCGRGDNLALLARKDAQKTEAALAAYEQLAALRDAPAEWRNRALYQKAKLLEQQQRPGDALTVLYDVLEQTAAAARREHFWSGKAGFDAARIFEQQKKWKEAIAVYEKLAALEGPRAAEARTRVKALRLEHFVWE